MAIEMSNLANGSDITALAASKLTGALPAIDGSALTGVGSPAVTTLFSSSAGVGSGTITLSGSFTGYSYVRFNVGRASKSIEFTHLAEVSTLNSGNPYAIYGYQSEHIYSTRISSTSFSIVSSFSLLIFKIEGVN